MVSKKHLKDYTRGWIVGNFKPSLFTSDCEVGIQSYLAGDSQPNHYHSETIEYNVVVCGECEFNIYNRISDIRERIIAKSGDIITIPEYIECEFIARTDCTIVCIKNKSIPSDKFLA